MNPEEQKAFELNQKLMKDFYFIDGRAIQKHPTDKKKVFKMKQSTKRKFGWAYMVLMILLVLGIIIYAMYKAGAFVTILTTFGAFAILFSIIVAFFAVINPRED